ncbi:MAG: hypothetical protein V4438_03635 [Patescibacteria group bacterium]
MKYPNMDWGTMEAVVNRLGGEEGVARFLRGEVCVVPKVSDPVAPSEPLPWTVDEEGNTHFAVTSNGMHPAKWGPYLRQLGIDVPDEVCNLLLRGGDPSLTGVVFNVVVVPGGKLSQRDRLAWKLRERAALKGWGIPAWDVACLISERYSTEQIKQMGIKFIATMHAPINGVIRREELHLFASHTTDAKQRFSSILDVMDGLPNGGGFAFIVPSSSNLK